MADLFDNGFETGDLTEFSGSVATHGTIAASTDADKNGTYGARATFDGLGGDIRVYETVTDDDEVWTRAWFRFSSGFTIGGGWLQMRLLGIHDNPNSTPHVAVAIQEYDVAGTWKWRLQFNYAPYTAASSPTWEALDTNWKRIELYSKNNGGTGDDVIACKIYDYDGTLLWDSGNFTHISADYSQTAIGFGGFDHNGDPANGDYIDLDDCAADTTGWIGDVTSEVAVEQSPLGTMEMTGYSPTVGVATGLWEMGAYIYTTQSGTNINVEPGLGGLEMVGHDPVVGVTDIDVPVFPGYGTMYMEAYNPIVQASVEKTLEELVRFSYRLPGRGVLKHGVYEMSLDGYIEGAGVTISLESFNISRLLQILLDPVDCVGVSFDWNPGTGVLRAYTAIGVEAETNELDGKKVRITYWGY